jgi:polyisoprenoid-binding protein YceI
MSITAETRTALPVGTWNLDPVHSQVGFSVGYLVGTFRGSFSPVVASLEIEEHGAAHLHGTANVADVKLQDANLIGHLQSPDFFDAERYPTLSFDADTIRRTGDKVEVEGELTMRGVTNPITLTGTLTDPIEDAHGNQRIGLTLEAEVDRTQYGINWNTPLPTGKKALADEVALSAELYLVKA